MSTKNQGQYHSSRFNYFSNSSNPRKKRNSFHKQRLLKIAITIIIVLFFLLSFLFLLSRVFKVKSIVVTSKNLDCANLEEIKYIVKTNSNIIFFIDSAKIQQTLVRKFICVKDVYLDKKYPDKVEVKIYTRKPSAILEFIQEASVSALYNSISSASSSVTQTYNKAQDSDSEKFVMDETGVLFSNHTYGVNVPIVKIAGRSYILTQTVSQEILTAMHIIEYIKKNYTSIFDTLIYKHDMILSIPEKIIFDLRKDTKIQLASLQLILEKAKIDSKGIESIDLRFDKPVLKYSPSK